MLSGNQCRPLRGSASLESLAQGSRRWATLLPALQASLFESLGYSMISTRGLWGMMPCS